MEGWGVPGLGVRVIWESPFNARNPPFRWLSQGFGVLLNFYNQGVEFRRGNHGRRTGCKNSGVTHVFFYHIFSLFFYHIFEFFQTLIILVLSYFWSCNFLYHIFLYHILKILKIFIIFYIIFYENIDYFLRTLRNTVATWS